ncbi:unnamed protein product [Periconia digitata]|uniref:Uncharacterized protein n=1 Tax=Periconia digitata TaxID=1303443 RepID=A0A9W4U3V7_9PLEO|nr:unnamed protein product [Periconia digitata]
MTVVYNNNGVYLNHLMTIQSYPNQSVSPVLQPNLSTFSLQGLHSLYPFHAYHATRKGEKKKKKRREKKKTYNQ